MEVNNFNKDFCIAPLHFLQTMCINGHSKPIALFLSFKRLFKSNHIHNHKKLNLALLGYPVSRKTYIKYINILVELKLATIEGNSIRLAGMETILKLYPTQNTDDKIKFIYLENNKDLRNSIEKVIIKNNLQVQSGTIRTNQRKQKTKPNTPNTVMVTKTVRGIKSEYKTDLSSETSLTCLSVAKMLGYKSSRTGHKREVKWSKEKFIDKTPRSIYLGILSKEIITQRRGSGEVLIGSSLTGYKQILANELIVLITNFGAKPQPKVNLSYSEWFGQF